MTEIAQKMKFFIKDFFNKSDADLVTFTEEIFKGKLHFFCSVNYKLATFKTVKLKWKCNEKQNYKRALTMWFAQ